MTSCSLVGRYCRFGGTSCFHLQHQSASVTQESWKRDIKKWSTFCATGNSRYEKDTSQGHNFVFHHKRNKKQYCDPEMDNFLSSVPTDVNRAPFLYSSYRSGWSSSLQAVYMIKAVSHPTHFNPEDRGTCSSETSVSTYKAIWCRNPKTTIRTITVMKTLKLIS